MALFSRRPQPDDALPVLTRPQADRLRAAVVSALAEPGAPHPVEGGDIVLSARGHLRLHDLARLVAPLPEQEWDDLVLRYVASMLAPPTDVTDPDAVRDVLLPRLLPAAPASAAVAAGHARTLAEGLAVRLALDLPDRVELLDDLTPFGGFAAAATVADANLRRLPAPEHHPLGTGGTLHLLGTDDFHGATRLLALDAVLARAGSLTPGARGTLVAVPNRHVLIVETLTGPDPVAATNAILAEAARGYDDAPGAITPDVYFREPSGALLRVSGRNPEGQTDVFVHGAFAEALESGSAAR